MCHRESGSCVQGITNSFPTLGDGFIKHLEFSGTDTSTHCTRLCQISHTMKASEEKQCKNQGFETWTSGKKPKTKPTSTKGVVAEENSKKADILAKTMQCPTLRSRKKQGSGRSRRSEAEGTIVITEKEYRLLLSLKEKSTEVSKKVDLDGEGVVISSRERPSSKEQTEILH